MHIATSQNMDKIVLLYIHEPPISWQSHFAPNPFHSDQFGLVRFNQQAEVHCPMKLWRTVNKAQLKREIGTLRPYGATCLSAAIDCATQLFSAAGIKNHPSVWPQERAETRDGCETVLWVCFLLLLCRGRCPRLQPCDLPH